MEDSLFDSKFNLLVQLCVCTFWWFGRFRAICRFLNWNAALTLVTANKWLDRDMCFNIPLYVLPPEEHNQNVLLCVATRGSYFTWKYYNALKGSVSGEKLLDIGTGPTVHSVISASRHVTEIHLSDLADRNRVVLQTWLDGTPNVVPVFEYILRKENDG